MKRPPRLLSVVLWAAAVALASCAPLPEGTLDPVRPAFGGSHGGPPSARDQWVGRYEDSRGSGELIVQLRRRGTQVDGVWRLRTGGDGVITGTLAADGSIRFQLASEGGSCLVLLDGVGKIAERTWTATYAGRDCEGPVTEGRFSLAKG